MPRLVTVSRFHGMKYSKSISSVSMVSALRKDEDPNFLTKSYDNPVFEFNCRYVSGGTFENPKYSIFSEMPKTFVCLKLEKGKGRSRVIKVGYSTKELNTLYEILKQFNEFMHGEKAKYHPDNTVIQKFPEPGQLFEIMWGVVKAAFSEIRVSALTRLGNILKQYKVDNIKLIENHCGFITQDSDFTLYCAISNVSSFIQSMEDIYDSGSSDYTTTGTDFGDLSSIASTESVTELASPV